MSPSEFFIPQPSNLEFSNEDLDNDIVAYRNAVHPTISFQRVNQLMKKFGVIHRRVGEINDKGLIMHWKTCTKMVNAGSCYYNEASDTFYIRSSCNAGMLSSDNEDSNKNMAYMEIERTTINPKYDTVCLAVLPPDDDYRKKKITTCEKHLKSSGQYTFFTVHNEDNSIRGTISYNHDKDVHKIDISGNTNQFIGFKVRFWCWSLCKKADFSNKHNQIKFMVNLSGIGVEDMVTHTFVNIQSNPGRGAGVVPRRTTIPDCTGPTPGPSKPILNQLIPENNNLNNNINFWESGRYGGARKIFVNVEIPKSFFDILGPGQARVEIEGMKRDISMTANWRIQDAINRKIAGNKDLLQENEMLKTAVSNLQHIIINNNRQAECLQFENNRLKMMLEDNGLNNAANL